MNARITRDFSSLVLVYSSNVFLVCLPAMDTHEREGKKPGVLPKSGQLAGLDMWWFPFMYFSWRGYLLGLMWYLTRGEKYLFWGTQILIMRTLLNEILNISLWKNMEVHVFWTNKIKNYSLYFLSGPITIGRCKEMQSGMHIHSLSTHEGSSDC